MHIASQAIEKVTCDNLSSRKFENNMGWKGRQSDIQWKNRVRKLLEHRSLIQWIQLAFAFCHHSQCYPSSSDEFCFFTVLANLSFAYGLSRFTPCLVTFRLVFLKHFITSRDWTKRLMLFAKDERCSLFYSDMGRIWSETVDSAFSI